MTLAIVLSSAKANAVNEALADVIRDSLREVRVLGCAGGIGSALSNTYNALNALEEKLVDQGHYVD
ncbi:MAG: hypothetical protein AAF438_17865 [Pseudomonadota bacterium]